MIPRCGRAAFCRPVWPRTRIRAADNHSRVQINCFRSFSTDPHSDYSKVLSLPEVWPLLQARFDKLKNPSTGSFDLLSPKNQAAMDQQFAQHTGNRRAAVLVLLIQVDDQPSLLFTRRAAHLSQHAAEISFPGGHHDAAADRDSLVDTAVREAVEELFGSLDNNNNNSRLQCFRSQLSILGTTSPLPSIRGVPVTPVIAVMLDSRFRTIHEHDNSATDNHSLSHYFPGDGGQEVDLVFAVSLAELLRVETTHTLPATRFNFQNNEAPCFPVPNKNQNENSSAADDGNILKIWGLTAYILRPVLRKLLKPVFFARSAG